LQQVYFTSWTAKIKRTFDDVTSSLCYNPRTAITYTASVPVAISMTVDVAGRFRLCETSRGVVDLMFNSARRPFYAYIGFTPLDPYMQFWAFMEDLEVTTPVEGIVDLTCVMRSFGMIKDVTMIQCGEDPPPDPNYPGYPGGPTSGPPSPDYPSPGTP
jgi:hypothetical protein